MNGYFKRTLIVNRVYLVDNIDYENLRDFLLEHGILPPTIIENIDSLSNRRQKVREMLDCLPRRADIVFPTFLVSLKRSNQSHIANTLYETTKNLIDPSDVLLKGWLENNIKTILSSSSAQPETNPVVPGEGAPSNANRVHWKHPTQVENSISVEQSHPSPMPMEAEDEDVFQKKGEQPSTDPSLSSCSRGTFPSSFTGTGKVDSSFSKQRRVQAESSFSSSLKSQVQAEGSYSPSLSRKVQVESQGEGSISSSTSSLESQVEYPTLSSSPTPQLHNPVYQMDARPRGLCCIITPEGANVVDSVPVKRNSDKKEEEVTCPLKNTGGHNDSSSPLKTDSELKLQTLFWDLGFNCCFMALDDSTLHPDKLNNIILQFSQIPRHSELNCCAIALLGFSADDLHLSDILSWFEEKNCPSLVGKPKLFLIQVPNGKRITSPSNMMAGVEIPEDALVAVGVEETHTKPGLVSSIVQVCQKMDTKSPYSLQEIFNQVKQKKELDVFVEESLRKQWIVDRTFARTR